MLAAMGKEVKEFCQVDFNKRLTELNLIGSFPPCTWPPNNAVRETATRISKLKKEGAAKPFVAVDLHK